VRDGSGILFCTTDFQDGWDNPQKRYSEQPGGGELRAAP